MTEREQIQSAILDAIEAMGEALAELRAAANGLAVADHAYRQRKAQEYLHASVQRREDGKLLTEDHRNAVVDLACNAEMLACRMAEARREAAREAWRMLQTQISAGQSLLSAERAESNALRYGQTTGA